MKKLKKIKLINWHTFYCDTIEIKDNCLITGENGSGKSTLLDAIQYVLTAGKGKFNQAADDNGKRSVETYIRGKVGYENKEFLRDEVTSYIVLEFFDDEKKQSDLLGVVFEFSTSVNKTNKMFFKMSNQEIEDTLFINADNCVKPLYQFRRLPKVEGVDSQKEFQSVIRSFLGIGGNNKYFELLAKSLAFKPINDVDGFVNSFLLSESSLSLETLQQNVENFSKLEREIEQEEAKVKKLEEIEALNDDYKGKDKKMKENEFYLKMLEKEELEKEVKSYTNQLDKVKQDIDSKTNDKVEKQKKIAALDNIILDYERSLKENDSFALYERWDKKLQDLNFERSKIESNVKDFEKKLKEEIKLLKGFNWVNNLNKFFSVDKELSNLKNIYNDCVKKKNEEKNIFNDKEKILSKECDELSRVKKDIEDKVNLLGKKEFPYKDTVIQLISLIKEYFMKNKNIDVEVRPLCEYLEIRDEKWRDAIEGYLNTQRFDLIIEPKYFEEALLVYEKYKKEKNIYGVGLVDVEKFEDVEAKENTLASYVIAKNIYAKRYAMFLLNKVSCCLEVKDLRNYKNAITPTCMTYRNNVARQIDPKVYKDSYVGQKGLEKQLQNMQLKLKEAIEKYDESLKVWKEVNDYLNCLKESELETLYSGLYDFIKCQEIKNEENECEKNKNNLQSIGIFNNILEEKEKFLLQKVNLNNEIEVIDNKIVDLRGQKENITEKIENKKEILNNYQMVVDAELIEKYQVMKLQKNNYNLKEELKRINTNYGHEIIKIKTNIENKQEEYNKLYQFDQFVGFENIDSYLNELYRKKQIDLVNKKSQSMAFKEACQISFREDFISKLRDKIEETQRNLKELNRALKGQPFGYERYEFVIDKSNDVELGNYYRIIMSGSNYDMNTLFENTLTEEDRQTLDDLFMKISVSNTEEKTKEIIDKYTDYRNYMSYDIKVTKENGESYSFSKLAKEKSGGEIQTPFYVIIASSFQQLLSSARRNSSTGCVVLFDEAFNNMDESRIEAMMNFYNKLNVQLLIAVPPEKAYIISPYVETNLVVISNDNGTMIKNIRLEEINSEEV